MTVLIRKLIDDLYEIILPYSSKYVNYHGLKDYLSEETRTIIDNLENHSDFVSIKS